MTLLYVCGSPRPDSESSAIAAEFLDAYREAHPDDPIDVVDVWDGTLPPFDGVKAAAKMTVFGGASPTGTQGTAWDQVTEVFNRFNAADRYLFTVPMWNGGVPWAVKHYIDIITQPGMLFGFDPATGYQPLLTGKRATVVYTSGVYAPGASKAFGTDFHSTYFTDWLHSCGITDVEEIRFQPTVLTADPESAREDAKRTARKVAIDF
jgi:FMN-dependent NADH-azoreductase